jgi:cobalt-zinc-cadmium efflux system outer membrane protein
MNRANPTRTPLLAILAAATCAACVAYQPAPVDLEAHLRRFAVRGGEALAGSREVTLEQATDIALTLRPSLRLARMEAGLASAVRDESGSWSDPELGLQLEKLLGNVSEPWTAFGTIGWTLPISGRPGLERAAATATAERALRRVTALEAATCADLTAAWIRWSASTLQLGLLEDLVVRMESLTATAARLAEDGAITSMAARTFRLELSRQTIERDAAAAATRDLEATLLEILGLPPQSDWRPRPQLRVGLLETDSQARQELAASGPAVAMARLAHTEAERTLELEIRKQWPELTLLPGLGREEGQDKALLGISFPVPLFDGNGSAIARASYERDLRAEELRIAAERQLQLLHRLEQRMAADLLRLERIQDELVPLADRQLEDGRRSIELGRLDPSLLLDAVLRAHAAAHDQITAEAALGVTRANLNHLCWQLDTAPNATVETIR